MGAYAYGNGGRSVREAALRKLHPGRGGEVRPVSQVVEAVRAMRRSRRPKLMASSWTWCPCRTGGGHAHVEPTRAPGARRARVATSWGNDKRADCRFK